MMILFLVLAAWLFSGPAFVVLGYAAHTRHERRTDRRFLAIVKDWDKA